MYEWRWLSLSYHIITITQHQIKSNQFHMLSTKTKRKKKIYDLVLRNRWMMNYNRTINNMINIMNARICNVYIYEKPAIAVNFTAIKWKKHLSCIDSVHSCCIFIFCTSSHSSHEYFLSMFLLNCNYFTRFSIRCIHKQNDQYACSMHVRANDFSWINARHFNAINKYLWIRL